MSEATRIIWLIALGVGLIGGIPYVIWMSVSIVKKRWRKLLIQIVVPMVILGLLVVATIFVEKAAAKEYLNGIYDAEVAYGDPIFEYHSERAFNGDGYSIEVYELPASIRKRFEAADATLQGAFPKLPGMLEDWEVEPWREAPFDPGFERYLSFALSSYDDEGKKLLAGQFRDIRAALSRKGTFYSFFKFDHGSDPGNIDLFIVDLEGGRVYQINHNT